MKKVVVLGAGISGLSAANFLVSKDIELTVLEKSARVGGLMNSIKKDGYQLETGPNSVMLNNIEFLELLQDLNLDQEIIFPEEKAAKNRFILIRDKAIALPSGPTSLFGNSIIGWGGIAALIREPFKKAKPSKEDESLAEFCERRFGKKLLQNVITPFVTGVYAGDPSAMSAKYAMTALWEAEQNHGSVIKGMIKGLKAKKADPQHQLLPKQKMISFKNGLQSIPNAITNKLAHQLVVNAEVKSVEKLANDQYKVTYTENEEEKSIIADTVISSLPAYVESKIWKTYYSNFSAELDQVNYVPTCSIHLGYDKSQVKNQEQGFGILTRTIEKKSFLGILFINRFFPHNAPKDKDLFAVIIGGARSPELTQLPKEELIKHVKKELSEIMNIEGEAELTNYIKWEKGIPQYNLGHEKLMNELELFENENPNYHIIGNYVRGVSVADSIKKGVKIAKKIRG